MNDVINFKDLYSVSLKTLSPITNSEGKVLAETGETVAFFDNIQIANFQEIKSTATSNGGWDNRSLVFWSTTKEVRVSLSRGVFSKEQLSLMLNSRLIEKQEDLAIPINCRETVEVSESGEITLKHGNPREPIFVYDKRTGEKINDWALENERLVAGAPYQELVVDYWYDYEEAGSTLTVGAPLTSGYLSLFGKMRVKDGETGRVRTGIIRIPKLRLTSELSINLGENATPQVGVLDAVAVPTGPRGKQVAMEIIFLQDDVDADLL